MIWQGALALAGLWMIWFSHRYAWWRPAIDWRRPRILMYHMVQEHRSGARFNGLRVTPARFERQVRWLHEQGFTFMTVSELWARRHDLPARTVAITFDDGYADNLHLALPILARYQACATVYVVVDRHDRDWSTYKKAHHDSGELARERKLTDDELRELVASGRIEIGSHTLTHCNLARTAPADRDHELVESRRQLEAVTGVPVRSFAYPFGIYSPSDVEAARAAGYETAVTTVEGVDVFDPLPDPLDLKRVKVSGKDSQLAFVMRLRGGRRGWRK